MHPKFSDRILARYAAIKSVKGVEAARAWVIARFGRIVYKELVSAGGWKKAPRTGGLSEESKRLLHQALVSTLKDADTKSRTDR